MTDPLRTSVATTLGVGLVAVVCLALLGRARLQLGAWYPVKAVASFSIVMLLAIRYRTRRHPFMRFGPANQITAARAGLVVLVGSLIGEPGLTRVAATAAAVSSIATLLDGLDGWLARRTGMVSAFGARFDAETDALLIQVSAILAWRYGKAGPWILLSGLMRYGFVAGGRLWPWMRQPLVPTFRGRMICILQTGALILAIMPAITPPLSAVIAAFGLAALGYSFLVDVLRLWRHADLDE